MEKKFIQLGVSILEQGFDSVLASNLYTRNELLAILDMLRFAKFVSKAQKNQILKIMQQSYYSQSFDDLRIGVLADTHIHKQKTNWEYIYRCYDEFAKRDIKTVLHLGDFYDGYYNYRNPKKKTDFYQSICMSQLEEFERKYPTGFTTYVCFGNHDAQFYQVYFDLFSLMNRTRKDVVGLGYGVSYVKWGKKSIMMKHSLGNKKILQPPAIHTNIGLYGHSHFFQFDQVVNKIRVPTCSDNHPNGCVDKNSSPGFLILENKDDDFFLERYVFLDHGVSRVLKI